MRRYPFETFPFGLSADREFPAPNWFRAIGPARGERGPVTDGTLAFLGRRYPVTGLAEGEEALAWYDPVLGPVCGRGRDHPAVPVADPDLRRAASAAAEAARVARDAEVAEAARDWVARFEPPFRWRLGHKPVVSGLARDSAGDGANRASVEHLLVLDAFAEGRLARRAGEFLCEPGIGFYGNPASGLPEGTPPTCRRCLDMAARFLTPVPARGPAGP